MANVYYNVTLSSAEAGSGPNYDVSYSNDCVTYLPATPATVTLESIGAQAYIQVPDTMQCIKLTNINSNCVNSVVSTITTSTTTTAAPTTTTTTLAGTTTTTTTTAAPTTTTTTISLITNGLVSWYGCDSLTGSNWLDKSGNGNNAQVSGSLLTSYNSDGYLFNSGNYVVWPETINQIPSGSYTLQYQGALRATLIGAQTAYDLWCKQDYIDGWDTVVKTTVEPVNYNYIYRGVGGDDKSMQSIDTQGYWLVTITCDSATNDTKLYLNGAFVANGDAGVVETFNAASTKRLVFGYNSNTDAYPFGYDNLNRVKELLLYNTELSAGEIATNYNYLNSYSCVPSGSTTSTTTTGAPTTTTTGAPTTTTTAPPYAYYIMSEYTCLNPGCILTSSNDINAAFPYGFTPVANRYYQPLGGSTGKVYRLSSGPYAYLPDTILLDNSISSTNCSTACAIA